MEPRRDELRPEDAHDPLRPRRKLPDPTVCPDCGATWIDGRWTWRTGPAEARRERCSACLRKEADYPAGFVTIRGEFTRTHRDEILRIARNVEARERRTHPVKRIVSVTAERDLLSITTTETRLAQSIGRALYRAFEGELHFDFREDIVRVDWERDV